MKSMGHMAYDVFRKELGLGLPDWSDLPDDVREKWEEATGASMRLVVGE